MDRLGIDLGGTKIEAAVLSVAGQVVAKRRVPTPNSYDDTVRAVRDLVWTLESEAGQSLSVGVGCPGSVSPGTGLMRNANAVFLNGRSFREDLEEALARPVRLANDGNCLALSEAVDGAAAGAAVVFAVILGTGCGGGMAVHGRLVEGASGIAGEWGHVSLPWPSRNEVPGPRCWCGKNGCLETWISGTGLQRDHFRSTGETLAGEEITAGARASDPLARATFDRLLDRLARALAMICNIVDPDVLVIAGGLSKVDEIYDKLPALITPWVFSREWSGKTVPAKWGDASGVRGAARLWP